MKITNNMEKSEINKKINKQIGIPKYYNLSERKKVILNIGVLDMNPYKKFSNTS